MRIQRQALQKCLYLLEHFPIAALLGPRQVGKTTLAKELMQSIQKPCLYLDLELDEDINKLTQAQLFLENHHEKCVILDEIQRMPKLFPLLRALVDRKKEPARFLILGSASPNLIHSGSETLAGRIAFMELTPFHITEISSKYSMRHHWWRGGYPDAFLADDERLSGVWLRNFVQTYLERDLRMLGLDADPVLMRRFWSMLAHYHGSILNASILGRSLGITVPTVSRYINFLEEAFIIRQLRPLYINLGKRLVKSPKIYIRDSGILHFLAGMADMDMLHGHSMLGHSWEGYVIEQIAQALPDDWHMYYYRTHGGAELDCVLVRGNTPVIGIEIKYAAAPRLDRGMLSAVSDVKTLKNFIIVPKEGRYPLREDILVCGLQEFLENQIKNG